MYDCGNGQIRFDGSSAFSQENAIGFFPGVSAGWRISEEEFMKNRESLKEEFAKIMLQ